MGHLRISEREALFVCALEYVMPFILPRIIGVWPRRGVIQPWITYSALALLSIESDPVFSEAAGVRLMLPWGMVPCDIDCRCQHVALTA